MKTYRGVEVWLDPRYPLDKKMSQLHRWSRRYGKEKILAPAWYRFPIVQLVASPYIDWAIPAPHRAYYNLPLMASYIIYNFPFVQTLLSLFYTFDLCSGEISIVLYSSVISSCLVHFLILAFKGHNGDQTSDPLTPIQSCSVGKLTPYRRTQWVLFSEYFANG
jgi:hypothetical protein